MDKILIIDKKLNKPYINEDRESFLYLDGKIAKLMNSKNDSVDFLDVLDKSFLDIKSVCLLSGAKTLIITGDNSNDVKVENLIKEELKPIYYNSKLSANITNLLNTKKEKYLLDFKNCNFIVPVVIKDDEKQSISYVAGNTKNNSFLYVAFSDLVEYNKWCNSFPNTQPLEVDSVSLKRIGKDHGFIFNPSGNKFVLNVDMLKRIPSLEEKDGEYSRWD